MQDNFVSIFKNVLFQKTPFQEESNFDNAVCVQTVRKLWAKENYNYSR